MANWNIDPLKDYYAVLGVLPSAELVVIRAAYRALALRYHPDQCQGQQFVAEVRMRELNEACEILSNEEARSRYDAVRTQNAGIVVPLLQNRLATPSATDQQLARKQMGTFIMLPCWSLG